VFEKDAGFNSNKDSTVRYHIHMLRKKLNDYYRNQGRNEKIRLVIPKGHYGIEFVSSRTASIPRWNPVDFIAARIKTAVIAVLLLATAFLAWFQFNPGRSKVAFSRFSSLDRDDPIWAPFFRNGYPVTIILGDDFLLDEYNAGYGRYRQIRDWSIDSESDLSNFLIRYPKANLWKSEITGIPFNGTDNLMDILPIVYRFTPDVSLIMSSTLSLEGIRNQNIIYIGELKNLRVLDKIFTKTPVRFQYRPDERLFILGDRGDTLNTFQRIEAPYAAKNKYNIDYSLLIKIPGFSSENILFIAGFGYSGRLERTKMLASAELRKKLVEDIRKINKSMPEYFIVLFEVKSIERTGFTNEIKYFKEIPRDFFNK